MLAESPQGHESPPFFQNEGRKNKRLADIKRGTEYYKKLDSIAEAQWRSNVPKFPSVPGKASLMSKMTPSILSESGSRRPQAANMTSTPRQSFSMASATGSTITGYAGTSMSLPSHVSRIIQHRESPFSSVLEGDENRNNYNTWGTNEDNLEKQTHLTSDDMKPRELPFQFRDSRKLVIKPIPKKSMPMSRVATNERDRHQRTVTNFRSRNGTIRIIKPLEPLPELEKYQKCYKPEAFDLENIEREKTFMMLERIDRILHPNKKSPRTLIGSSEEEIPGSSDSSVTLTEDAKEPRDPVQVNIQDDFRRSTKSPGVLSPLLTPRLEHSSMSKGRRSRTDRVLRPRIKFHEDPFKSGAPKSFKDILRKLDISQEDTDIKCQSWIERNMLNQ